MKEKHFWMVIAVIVFIWIGNFTYLHSQQLEKPIVLKHYYDLPLEEQTNMRIYYLTNKDQTRLDSADINGTSITISDRSTQVIQEFRHHYLKMSYLEIDKEALPLKIGENGTWTFNQIIPSFWTGTSEIQRLKAVDIGLITITSPNRGKRAFEYQMMSSSSRNRTYTTNRASEAVTINEITIPFSEQFSNTLKVKVDLGLVSYNPGGEQLDWGEVPGTPLDDIAFPIQLDKGDSFSVYTQLNENQKTSLLGRMKVRGVTKAGESFEFPFIIQAQPRFTQQEIDQMIKEHKGGDKP
ncbi:hypothetical protein [Pseudalkalibacillus sp. SCS-8]|uniref:hypothetical protein n=1 Tax=Pseudalkalibacillus nanhaiensis TaxID=3115291 RepID=UPI0032DB41B2